MANLHNDNKTMSQKLDRVIAFIDTGGAAPDPWGHSKDEKREAALTMLAQYMKFDIFSEWTLKLLKNCHYQAAITFILYTKIPDYNAKGFASSFANNFLDIQLTKRCIANSYLGKDDKK